MSLSDPESNPPAFKFIGLGLAVLSGVFIGSSFVFKKKGLLSAQKKYATTAGDSHAYLKSPLWWTGMMIMVLGEILNFVAYAFADAILVTPMGALSVVVCAILSSIFLKECLTLFGKVGCFLCIVGSVIIAINAPEQKTSGNIHEYQKLFIAPGFLTWLGICVVTALIMIFFVAPRYGKKTMLVYITVCSVIGGLSVSVTSGLGSAIILSIRGQNQFTYWFTYFLLVFIVVTLLVEINYLNKALELFNTAAVTPTYYVMFTAATIITSIILSKGMRASAATIVTIVFGFFTICSGIVLLQLSKMDPEDLEQQKGFDRKSSMLVRMTQMAHDHGSDSEVTHMEDPGIDSVRGGLGVVGSIVRARSVERSQTRSRSSRHRRHDFNDTDHGISDNVQRYQLYDRPVSHPPALPSPTSPTNRYASIKFAPDANLPHGHHDPHLSPKHVPRHEPSELGDDMALPLTGAIDIGHALAPILEHHKKRSASQHTSSKGSQRKPSTARRSSNTSRQASEKQIGHTIHGQDIAFDWDEDPYLGEPSISDAHQIELPPLWDPPSDLAESGVASPTMIVDEYYREPISPASPASNARSPSVHGFRSFSRGKRTDASHEETPHRDALGLFKLRKPSRANQVTNSGANASKQPSSAERDHLLP
ncbi:hypothetical protein MYAM1_003589 [Malassezia yamatoensis]|uniref:DUF803-domain-containing protein n=1 Tax=Malassezia yamatoensis TaxID=253288 RepID=A0AAJ5YUX4_9BASI|nr:hypothetical protein MYAM1_003589 [Malassezia yamatoensis]